MVVFLQKERKVKFIDTIKAKFNIVQKVGFCFFILRWCKVKGY
jgi:hypothetical protein